MSTIRYLEPGVDRKLFQCSFNLVRLDVWVETGPSKVIFTLPLWFALYVSLFLGTDVADDAEVCDLGTLGDFVPVDKN